MDSYRLTTLLRRLHLTIRAEAAELLRAKGFDDISTAHIYVFQTPGPDGARPTDLAQSASMTKQAMNHLLAGLEERGYIKRVAVGGDGRSRVVRLTARGRRLTNAIQEAAAEIQHRWTQQLGAARMHELLAALEDLDAVAASEHTRAVS